MRMSILKTMKQGSAEAYHVLATTSVGQKVGCLALTEETKGDTHNSPTITKDGLSE